MLLQIVAVDSLGNIYFSEETNIGRVRKFSVSSQSVSTITGTGASGAGSSVSLNNPNGLHIDTIGNIYIADYLSRRILKQDLSTLSVSIVASGLNGPHHAWSDINGNIYIAGNKTKIIIKNKYEAVYWINNRNTQLYKIFMLNNQNKINIL